MLRGEIATGDLSLFREAPRGGYRAPSICMRKLTPFGG